MSRLGSLHQMRERQKKAYARLRNGHRGGMAKAGREFDDGRFELVEAQPAKAAAPQLSGDACGHCGNFALVRTGTCQTCQACGETSGCS